MLLTLLVRMAASGCLSPDTQHANTLYHNNGDLTFTDISAASGVDTALGGNTLFRPGVLDD